MRKSKILLLSALFAGLSGSVLADSAFKIGVQPVFQGALSQGRVLPLEVEVQNTGADAKGVLRVTANGSVTTYPMELPRGADKRLIVYPTPFYGTVSFSLSTDRGDLATDFPVPGGQEEGMHILMMSDVPGELAFIRAARDETPSTNGPPGSPNALAMLDCYSKPGVSPNRPLGYDGVSCIILGSGSERLTDDEVDAIRMWVASGRTLVFIGGASAPILTDPRWLGLLPAHSFHVESLAHSSVLTNLGGSDAPNISITSGTPVEGTTFRKEGSNLISAEKPFGIGKVIYLSFNPFEGPMSKWDGRKPTMVKLLRVTGNLAANSFLGSYVESDTPSQYAYGGRAVAMGPAFPVTSRSPAYGTIKDDPFDTKLPPVERILMILASYFVVVIPINFLVLRKLKKGELAWFTAPVISLGFAGILFASAGSLYAAKMSTVTNGVVIAQEGNHDGFFAGTSQLFIPRGGSYDLKLTGVDSLQALESDDYAYYGGPRNRDFEAVDVGEYTVPNLVADNLSFKRLSYRQRVPASTWFHVKLIGTGARTARYEVSNVGPNTLMNATLVAGHDMITLGSLRPGDRKAGNVTFPAVDTVNDLASNDVRVFTVGKKRAALTGDLDGFRPGPKMGEEIKGRSSVKLFMFSDWEANP